MRCGFCGIKKGRIGQCIVAEEQVITLSLAITLRVTLVRDFVKSLLTLYIYIYYL